MSTYPIREYCMKCGQPNNRAGIYCEDCFKQKLMQLLWRTLNSRS